MLSVGIAVNSIPLRLHACLAKLHSREIFKATENVSFSLGQIHRRSDADRHMCARADVASARCTSCAHSVIGNTINKSVEYSNKTSCRQFELVEVADRFMSCSDI